MQNPKRPSRALLILAFIAVYFIWGTTYLAIAYAVKGIGPFAVSAMRYLSAGVILSVWALLTRKVWPAGKDWRVLIISGILMLSGGTGLVVVGEKYISSGSAAVIMATEPLFFILLDKARWKSYFSSKWIIVGLLVGFAGIALFACFTPSGATATARPVLGTIITLLSAVAWVTGALYANYRLSSKTGTAVHSAVQLLAAGVFSGAVAVVRGEWPAVFSGDVAGTAWAGVAYLTVMGSLVAYLAFNWLLTVQPPAIVSTHTYVNPVIAVFVGWLVAAEQVGLLQLIALVIVITGVVITQTNKGKIEA